MFEIADRVLGAHPDNVKQSIAPTPELMAVSACKIYQSVLIFSHISHATSPLSGFVNVCTCEAHATL